MNKIKNTIQSKILEIIYNEHIDGKIILEQLKNKKYGVYKAFVKWHMNGTNHTHVAVILRDKPKLSITTNSHKAYFIIKVGEVGDKIVKIIPHLVKPIGIGNTSPMKKMATYLDYLTDGHDNDHFKDTWNYKLDYELLKTKSVIGKCTLLMSRGQTIEQIYKDADWDFRADISISYQKIKNSYKLFIKILQPPPPKKLRKWQVETLEHLKSQGNRKILWIIDKKGNQGKTFLVKQMALHHRTAVFSNGGKKDLAFAYDDQPIVAFNLTRQTNGRVNYEAMEQLKDGLMFSGKYESQTKVFDAPAMVVMSNFEPDYSSMSQDRWQIGNLNEGILTVTKKIPQENLAYYTPQWDSE